jgi:hypothetical protein
MKECPNCKRKLDETFFGERKIGNCCPSCHYFFDKKQRRQNLIWVIVSGFVFLGLSALLFWLFYLAYNDGQNTDAVGMIIVAGAALGAVGILALIHKQKKERDLFRAEVYNAISTIDDEYIFLDKNFTLYKKIDKIFSRIYNIGN